MMRRGLVLVAAVFVAAGGYLHLREWLDVYRDLPASVPGSAVVRIGFPLNAVLSFVLAAALVATLGPLRRHATAVVVGTLLFQVASLATLIQTRTGSLFGWMEAVWTPAANQIRFVEIGASVALGAALVVAAIRGERPQVTASTG